MGNCCQYILNECCNNCIDKGEINFKKNNEKSTRTEQLETNENKYQNLKKKKKIKNNNDNLSENQIIDKNKSLNFNQEINNEQPSNNLENKEKICLNITNGVVNLTWEFDKNNYISEIKKKIKKETKIKKEIQLIANSEVLL